MARFLAMVRAGLPCPRCGGPILPLHPAIPAKFCLQCGCSGRVPRLAPKDDDLEGITESLWTLTLTQLLEEQVAWRKWRGCESKVSFATFEEAEEMARKTDSSLYGPTPPPPPSPFPLPLHQPPGWRPPAGDAHGSAMPRRT